MLAPNLALREELLEFAAAHAPPPPRGPPADGAGEGGWVCPRCTMESAAQEVECGTCTARMSSLDYADLPSRLLLSLAAARGLLPPPAPGSPGLSSNNRRPPTTPPGAAGRQHHGFAEKGEIVAALVAAQGGEPPLPVGLAWEGVAALVPPEASALLGGGGECFGAAAPRSEAGLDRVVAGVGGRAVAAVGPGVAAVAEGLHRRVGARIADAVLVAPAAAEVCRSSRRRLHAAAAAAALRVTHVVPAAAAAAAAQSSATWPRVYVGGAGVAHVATARAVMDTWQDPDGEGLDDALDDAVARLLLAAARSSGPVTPALKEAARQARATLSQREVCDVALGADAGGACLLGREAVAAAAAPIVAARLAPAVAGLGKAHGCEGDVVLLTRCPIVRAVFPSAPVLTPALLAHGAAATVASATFSPRVPSPIWVGPAVAIPRGSACPASAAVVVRYARAAGVAIAVADGGETVGMLTVPPQSPGAAGAGGEAEVVVVVGVDAAGSITACARALPNGPDAPPGAVVAEWVARVLDPPPPEYGGGYGAVLGVHAVAFSDSLPPPQPPSPARAPPPPSPPVGAAAPPPPADAPAAALVRFATSFVRHFPRGVSGPAEASGKCDLVAAMLRDVLGTAAALDPTVVASDEARRCAAAGVDLFDQFADVAASSASVRAHVRELRASCVAPVATTWRIS